MMRNNVKVPMTAILALLVMAAGCKKVNFDELSKITISGNSYEGLDFNKTFEAAGAIYDGLFEASCPEPYYRYTFHLALQPEATLRIALLHHNWDEVVPEGTYSIVASECAEGSTAQLNETLNQVLHTLEFSGGTVKVNVDDGTYDIDIELTISPGSGGGTLKGNFTGTLQQG